MADGKVLLEVVVEGKNVKVVQREVEQVTDAVNDNTSAQDRNTKASRRNADAARAAGDAHNHFDRGLKGSAGVSSNTTKNFSKMRDAMGGSSGLVGAYATLAANLFAATAAFAALQRAAQVEQLTQGLSALGAASGLAMGSLSRGLQESTGYAISLQDSMRQVAMVTSAGFDPATIDRLGAVAKNTSIALGRDLQDSMNRLVKGATKLEPELLDELGIMVRIDEATQKYAERMGKSASQLTNFEKRQAFMNAVLEEGEKKFGAIGDSVDANPYDRLSASLQELAATVLNAFNSILGPIVGFLADSKLALAGLIAILSKGIIGQALPALSQMANATAALAVRTSEEAKVESENIQRQIANRKESIGSLEAVIGKRGEAIDLAFQEAESIQDLTKVQSTLNRSIAARSVLPNQEEAIKALEIYRDKLKEIIELEAKRKATEAGGGDDAIKARTDYLVKGAERINSLDETPTFKNYKEQFVGALEDAKKLRQELATSGGAVTPFSESISELGNKASEFGEKMAEAGGISGAAGKTLSFVGRTVKALGVSLGTGATAWRSFGTAAKIAIKGIFTAIPIIGELLFFYDLLKSAILGLINLFRSDASKQYSDSLDTAAEATKELGKNSIEVNKAIIGSSKSITSSSALIESQANIVSQVSDSFYKLKDAASAANEDSSAAIDNLNQQIQANILLQRELKNLTGGYTDLVKYIEDKNLSEEEAIKVSVKYVENINKMSQANLNLVKTVEDTNQAFSQYYNTLFQTTPYTNYINKLEDVKKALQSARAERDKTGDSQQFNTAVSAAFSKLTPDQAKFLGLDVAKAELDSATKGAESFSRAVAEIKSVDFRVNFTYQDVKKIEDALKSVGLEVQGLGLEQITGEKDRLKILEIIERIAQKASGRAEKLSEEAEKRLEQETAIKEAMDIKLQILNREKQSLEYINSLIKLSNFETKASFDSRQKLQDKIYTDEISYITDEINQQQKLVSDETADRRAAETKLIELASRRGILITEQANFSASTEIENAKRAYTNLERRMSGEQEIVSILQKQLDLSKSILESRISIEETSLQLQNIQQGGEAALSARQQLEVFRKFENQKTANINREYGLKLRTINMEEKLNNAKLAILRAELAKDIKDLQKQSAATPQDTETQQNLVALKDAYTALQGLNYSQIAVQQRTQANLDREKAITDDKLKVAVLDKANTEATAQVSADLIQRQIDLANVTGNIQEKINSSKSTILDNERTIRENELKAINLRNKGIGEYELTAQQTLQLEMEFGEKKKALLREEEEMKLRIIDLEYKLMGAQLKIQEITLKSQLQTLKNQTTDPAELGNIQTLIDTLPGVFAEAAVLLPQAAQAAAAATRSETEAAVSEITAAQIQAQQAVFGWTQKMTTSWQDISTAIGQNFLKTLQDAKSITQELADIFSNAVNSAVDSFVDAIVEGKNAFKAIGSAVRDSLREGLAEAAKNKLKEGIAGLFTASGMGGIAEVFKTPQDKAIEATKATTKAITETAKSHTDLLQEIANNTANCCGGSVTSMPVAGGLVPTLNGFKSGINEQGVYTAGFNPTPTGDPKTIDYFKESQKWDQKNYQLGGMTYDTLDKTSINTANTVKETSFWGDAQTYATENVGTIAAAGFAQMAAALAAGASPKKALLGGVLGAIGGAIGGAVGGPAGAMIGSQIGGTVGSSFEKGGVMSSSGPMPLEKYARGGIARTPQLAMFGEGSRPEAYVPLPDGRTIPVTMSNGGGNTNNIAINVAVDGSGSATTNTSSKDNTEEYSRRLGTAISNAVKQEIFNQQRPGGLLFRGRR